MAYTINKTNGSVVTTIADGTIDNTTDITLIGKNYSGYGEILNENFVKLMENFASSSAPDSPLAGQLWWDLANNSLKVYTGTNFKIISGSTASATQPASAVLGDLWFDTVNAQLRVYNGASWTLIGPSFTAGTGVSGAQVTTVTDSGGAPHVVVLFYVNETVVAILSKDPPFTPQTGIIGFTQVYPGFQLSNDVTNAYFTGTATNSQELDGVGRLQFLRSDENDTTTGSLLISNDNGLTIGDDSDLKLSVASADVYITNQTTNGDMYFRVNKSVGSTTIALAIDGATGFVTTTTPTAGDNSTKLATTAYVDNAATGFLRVNGANSITGVINPTANATIDFGSTGLRYRNIYCQTLEGTATTAEYADLAERFEADALYEPGTVVELGGEKEITAVATELSDNVFGVISTQPGFLLNNKAGSNQTHPAVALSGRVPVKVIGKIKRGDRLVAAGNGLARAAQQGETTMFNVIGRSLEDKTTDGISTVNAVVKTQ